MCNIKLLHVLLYMPIKSYATFLLFAQQPKTKITKSKKKINDKENITSDVLFIS